MLRNYLLLALRGLRRHPLYSFINIGGLAAGLAVSVLILLYVAHEFSYDGFHANGERIFKTMGRANYGGEQVNLLGMSAQVGPRLQRALPGVVLGQVRSQESPRAVLKTSTGFHSFEDHLHFADASAFRVFTLPFLRGNPALALTRPGTLVLTETLAKKYFGTENPLGKILTYNGQFPLEVTGVVQDLPSNSTLDFEGFISFATLNTVARTDESVKRQLEDQTVGFGGYITYFLLRSPTDRGRVERMIQRLQKQGLFDPKQKPDEFILEPLRDLHLYGAFVDHSQQYHGVFLGVALTILLLALINYMNLATARATQRAKEIGVRKTLGGLRKQVAAQFYVESALTTVLAFALGMALVLWLRPLFFGWLDLRVDARFLSEPLFLQLLAGVLVLSVALAGSYPALLLSRFAPVEVLKGRFSKTGGAGVRRVLTVFQFVVSVGLIGCSLVVYQQLTFLKTQKAGLDKAGVVVVPVPATLARHYAAFKAELRQQPGIQRVSAASWPLFKSGMSMFFTKTPKTKKEVMLMVASVDNSFFETMGVPWKTRPATAPGTRPENTLVLNQAALPQLDLKGNPVGEKLELGIKTYDIEGVVQDFNLFSLRQQQQGLAITVSPDTASSLLAQGGCFYLKLAPGTDVPRQLARVEALFKRYEAEYPFEFYFLDEAYAALYKLEARLGAMFAVFTGVALLIACLGLFGLATFAVETRTKEIGIRKVLGASVASIVTLLSGGFVKLILISVVIASPLVWWAMQRWLQDFATRIDFGGWIFALAGGLALVVALLTVGAQAVKAALANPVDSLRSE